MKHALWSLALVGLLALGSCSDDDSTTTPTPNGAPAVTLSNVSIDGGTDTATVGAGFAVEVTVDYEIANVSTCADCSGQIIVGVGATASSCIFNGKPPVGTGNSGTVTFEVTAPSTPGTYDIFYKATQEADCDAGLAAYEADPPSSATKIGTLVVVDANSFFVNVTNLDIDGQGNAASVEANTTFDVTLDYELWNGTNCPSCIIQIVLGIDEDGQDCAYSAVPGLFPGAAGNGTVTLTAPATPGTYEIRYRTTAQFTCGAGIASYDAAPPTGNVLGTITVTPNTSQFYVDISGVDIGGLGASVVVAPNEVVSLGLDYTLWNSAACPSCIIQIVVGVDGDAQGCAYSSVPGAFPGVSGRGNVSLTAPAATGTYQVRYKTTAEFSCNGGQTNYESAPPSGNAIASITVADPAGFSVLIDQVDLDGQGPTATVVPGATVQVNLDYQIWNPSGCPGCVSQIVIGLEDVAVQCVYSDVPGLNPGDSGSASFSITAPLVPGVYAIRYSKTQQFTCEAAIDQYNSAPPTSNVIGTIIVP